MVEICAPAGNTLGPSGTHGCQPPRLRGPGFSGSKTLVQTWPSLPRTKRLLPPGLVESAVMGEPAGNVLGPSGSHGDQTGFCGSKTLVQTWRSLPRTKRLVPPGLVESAVTDEVCGKTLGPRANHGDQ